MIAAMKLKNSCSLEGKLWQIWHHIKKQRHHFADKGPYSQSYILMWELYHNEAWVPKNWTVVVEKTLESLLDCSEIKPINPKGNQHWILIGRTDAKAEAQILWSPDSKSQLIEKDPDDGKDWGKEEERVTEDQMVGWHHQINGHEFEQTPGHSEGQGSLACCSPGHKKLDLLTQQQRCDE